MAWNPDQYLKFQAERFAPFEDLAAMIAVRPGLRVVDLGCGTGELTARLADLLPGSTVIGIDSSDSMLERARPLAREGLSFELRPVERLEGEWDLIFSNAALQWVADHEALFPSLIGRLRPGGQLAVQMPNNHDHPASELIPEIASRPPFAEALTGWSRRSPLLTPRRYAELLWRESGRAPEVFEKYYPHVLEYADAVAEWSAGTALLPYMERLPAPMKADFFDTYRAELRQRMPGSPVYFGFRRLLLSARVA